MKLDYSDTDHSLKKEKGQRTEDDKNVKDYT